MSQVQEKYKHAEENYGSELLNLVVAKGYLKKLMDNEAVRSYVARHAPEILEQFVNGGAILGHGSGVVVVSRAA